MNKRDTERWLKRVPVISQPTDEQLEQLHGLYGSDGLTVLLGLMLGARQGQYVFLSNMPLGGAEQDCAAAVIQGQIRGVEMLFNTVREMAIGDDSNAPDPRQRERNE